jgi:hypothetical protein
MCSINNKPPERFRERWKEEASGAEPSLWTRQRRERTTCIHKQSAYDRGWREGGG